MNYGLLRSHKQLPLSSAPSIPDAAPQPTRASAIIDPSQVKEIWALTRHIQDVEIFGVKIPDWLVPDMSIHSGFLAVTKDNRIFAIQGGPSVKEPRTPFEIFKLAAREACHRLGLWPRPEMGYMVPQITELHENPAALSGHNPLGQKTETTALGRVTPGKGAEGVIFSDTRGTKTMTQPILSGADAQAGFQILQGTVKDFVRIHPHYELAPNLKDGTANCHLFTETALRDLREAGLLSAPATRRIYEFLSPMVGTRENSFSSNFLPSWLNRTLFSVMPDGQAPSTRPAPARPLLAPAIS